jgi:ribosomal protein S18 acetylase RimI-like enzyme
MKLQPATDDDFRSVISWIPDGTACKLWAGPLVRFPLSLENLKEKLQYRPENTYSLKDDKDVLLGFGQILEKADARIHLARIIISPSHRHKGIGKQLCRLLMEAGRRQHGECEFSLNVYAENAKARNLYIKLGFRQHPPPAEFAADASIVYMLKACQNKRILNDERQC